MNADTPHNEVRLHHLLDAAMQQTGGKLDLDTPAGPLSMTLPAGLTEGQTLRLAGRGELGPDGKRGDVLLTVSFFAVARSTPPAAAIPQSPVAAPVKTMTPVAPTTADTVSVLAATPVPDDPSDELPPVQAQGTNPIRKPSTTTKSAPREESKVGVVLLFAAIIGGFIYLDHFLSPVEKKERRPPPTTSRVMCFTCKGEGKITKLIGGQIVKMGCPTCMGTGSRPAD